MLLLWCLYFLPHHQASPFSSSPAFSLDCIVCHSTTLVRTLASTLYLPISITHPLQQANLRYDQQSTFSRTASEQSHWVVENHKTGQMEITMNLWPPISRWPSTLQGSSLYYSAWKVFQVSLLSSSPQHCYCLQRILSPSSEWLQKLSARAP